MFNLKNVKNTHGGVLLLAYSANRAKHHISRMLSERITGSELTNNTFAQ